MQTVTFSVIPINEFSITGNPGTLVVSTSAAGARPNSVADKSTRYAIITNGTDRKITAEINRAMPAGVALTVDLAAPTGASSASAVILKAAPTEVIMDATGLNQSVNDITYELSAIPEAGVALSERRTVTLTITAGAM